MHRQRAQALGARKLPPVERGRATDAVAVAAGPGWRQRVQTAGHDALEQVAAGDALARAHDAVRVRDGGQHAFDDARLGRRRGAVDDERRAGQMRLYPMVSRRGPGVI